MADRAEPEDHQGRAENAKATADPVRIFVSYASSDAAVAGALVELLERNGISCWIAPRDVKAGALYADAIVRAISGAKALVLVLSESAIGSSHVGKEVERASSKKRPIIALRIDNARLTPALEYFLSESQWIEAQSENKDPAYASLINAIQEPERAAPGISPAVPPSGHTSPPGRRNRILLVAVLAVVAVALAALLVDKFWPAKHIAAEQRATSATGVISDKSIAVLPFTDMSEKKNQEYLADGVADEILNSLAKIRGLTVIGRTSSFQFKGRNEDLRAIGAKLNAAYVLEGSVRYSGDTVRVTAQLINARTGAHEWSETYDRQISDVLKLQDAVAAAVARELQLTVAPGDMDLRAAVRSAEAYDLYLRGRHAYDRNDSEGADEAATLFQRALDRDPTFADAAAGLAATYVVKVMVGSLAPIDGFEQARRAAAAALKLDPKSAEAHAVLGSIHIFYDWDWVAAERELQQAMAVAPGNVDVQSVEATLLYTLGHWDDALRQIKAALAQDPLNPDTLNLLSTIQDFRGHLPEAEAAMRRVLDIRPTYGYGHYNLGLLLLGRGDRDAALLEIQQELIDDGRQQGLAIVYWALGRKADADVALAGMLKEQGGGTRRIAEVYAFRGQSDEAVHWLERAYAQKEPYLYYIKGDRLLKNLRSDPRFKAILRKMNLPE